MTGPKTLSEEALVALYRTAMEDEKLSNWARGDIAVEIARRADEEKTKKGSSNIVEEFLKKTGDSKKSFSTRARISEKFPESSTTRNLPLDWTMFRIAASTEEPEVWLNKAHDNSWTCRQFNEALDTAKAKRKSEDGAPCACGCEESLPEDPIFLGGVLRHRAYFYNESCVIKFLTERINNPENKIPGDTKPGKSIEDYDLADLLDDMDNTLVSKTDSEEDLLSLL
jgi:hypothetical protein